MSNSGMAWQLSLGLPDAVNGRNGVDGIEAEPDERW